MPLEWFAKKKVKTYDGGEQEVIEFFGVEGPEFLRAAHRYIHEFFGIAGENFKQEIWAFPRRRIYSDADRLKPMYQVVEITNFGDRVEQVYFEMPSSKH